MRTLTRILCGLPVVAAVTLASAPASADVILQQRYEEISIDVNTCTGEDVLLTGTLFLLVRSVDGTGGIAVRYTYYLTGTGLTTGSRYVVNVQSAFTATSTSFASTYRSTMVSTGPAPNQTVVARVSSDGSFTMETVCRG